MCGIAGLALAPGAPPVEPATLAMLADALAHRGPDGAGHSLVGRVALVHRRLAIIDVAGGDQPLFAGAAALVANGEIYNFHELRAALPEVSFATGSDCEPPLHLWLRDPRGYAEQLRGMYAIAIHQRSDRSVTLSRDPFGIKPLYYAPLVGRDGTALGVAFASEAQALLAAGLVERRVRPAARAELLQLQFTTGAETIFPGLFRLLPGETLRISDGRIVERRRLAALPEGSPEEISQPQALLRLDHALMESVALHQQSDVPYGLFLSGGVDSAALLAVMARLNDRPVQCFTAGFAAGAAADERAEAAALARAVGAEHHSLEVTADMVWAHLPAIVAAMDDPAADYAVIPSWFLARQAAASVKVVLSGEGGDEVFAGYGRYRSAMRPAWLGGRLMRARGSFDGLSVLRVEASGWRDGIAAAEAAAVAGSGAARSRLALAQATDMVDWLPHDLLLKLDRCLMAHGVEGRTPFLDQAVAAAAYRLPDRLKVRRHGARLQGKWLLRQWLATALPAARPFAPKQGFTVPVGAWIAAEAGRLGALVAARPAIAAIAKPSRVAALFRAADSRREGFAAWTLLFYALWHRAHVEARPPVGDVFATLAD